MTEEPEKHESDMDPEPGTSSQEEKDYTDRESDARDKASSPRIQLSILDPSVGIMSWMDMILYMLRNKKLEEAAHFALQLYGSFKDHELFTDWSPSDLNDEKLLSTRVVETLKLMYIAPHMRIEEERGGREKGGEGEEEEEEEDELEEEGGNDREKELLRTKRTIAYLKDTLSFSKHLQEVLNDVCKLFKSQNNHDVMEAVEFVVTCAQFKVPGSQQAMRRLSNLVWKRESTVRDAVVDAFKKLYLEDKRGREMKRSDHEHVAECLIDLTMEASESELASLEEVIAEMVHTKVLPKSVIDVFWEYLCAKHEASVPKIRACLRLIAMAARKEKSIVSSNLDRLMEHGLGDRASVDFGFAKDVCNIIEKIGQKIDLKDEKTIRNKPFRLDMNHDLFQRLQEILVNGCERVEDEQWTPLMEKALNVLFFISEHPEETAQDILVQLGKKLKEQDHESTTTFLLQSNDSSISIEEDMGLGSTAAEDEEQENANHICNTQILREGSALGNGAELLMKMCDVNNWNVYSTDVQIAAALALSKLMLVRLQDPDHSVRQNCMLVLTHLILNDMIKVKGHVAAIALVILDPKPEMAGLARNFFDELSRKGNAVYNLMPNIVSRLSDPSFRVEPENFQKVMKFLLAFISKEKQCESLVQKICERFPGAQTPMQWRHLSFCLCQLKSYNEKSLQKLSEAIPCFAAMLSDEEVYQNISSILTAARKAPKVTEQAKELCDELEEQVEKIHMEGAANEELIDKIKLHNRRRSLLSKTPKTKTPTRRSKKIKQEGDF